ncbi:MAG: hypothetical protein IJI14_12085 [Anaerolineaceae bacterium]|nr:hypothetical protein [Anaerolineaceae bacterium]
MQKKDFDTILKGVKCCSETDSKCEACPYVAAAENCGSELDADLYWMASESADLLDWTTRALSWMRRERPDDLIAMVDAVGIYPEILSETVFGNGEKNA